MTTQFRQNVPSTFGDGGTGLIPNGSSVAAPLPTTSSSTPRLGTAAIPQNPDLSTVLWALLARVAPVASTYAALLAFGAGPAPSNAFDRADGMFQLVAADSSIWFWSASASGSTGLTPNDNPPTGRWLPVTGGAASQPQAGPSNVFALAQPQNGQTVYDTTTSRLWAFNSGSSAYDPTQNLVLGYAAWATSTPYGVDAFSYANGGIWKVSSVLGSGTSASTGSGPSPTGLAVGATFVDDAGSNQVVWTLVRTYSGTPGAWVRVASTADMKLAVGFATADGSVLFTVPAGMKLRVTRACWEVTTGWTGGTSSAIGVSSSNTHYNTPGDILGGGSGDVAATLVTTGGPYVGGTVGTKFGSSGVVGLVAGDTVKFNRVTSAFAAGAGFVHLSVEVLN